MLGPRELPRDLGAQEPTASKPRVIVLVGTEEILTSLRDPAWELVDCKDGKALLEAVVERRPSAVVVAYSPTQASLGLLSLVRRAAPHVPFILLACDGDLELQKALQEMRPYYYDLVPFDPDEVREAVRSAVSPTRARSSER
jgi:DNA-binding NtrC family response regulator